MCGDHFALKKHSYFKSVRSTYINASLCPSSHGNLLLTDTPFGKQCVFSCPVGRSRTIFLEKSIGKGVYRWTVRIKYGSDENIMWMGVAPADQFHELDGYCFLGDKAIVSSCRSCSLGFRCNGGVFTSFLLGVRGNNGCKNETSVPDDSVVAAEVDSESHTLTFYVNGKRVPYGVSSLEFPLYFGMSACDAASFISLSLRRLRSPTTPLPPPLPPPLSSSSSSSSSTSSSPSSSSSSSQCLCTYYELFRI